MELSILILLLFWAAVGDGIPHKVCDIYDETYGIPVGAGRTCSVLECGSSVPCISGSSYCHETTTHHCFYMQSWCGLSCPGFIGMTLTYDCTFEGAQLYRYKNEQYFYLNGSSVTYNVLQPENAGLYECRNSSNKTVYSQNITINEEVRIGSINNGCTDFGRDTSNSCCRSSTMWSPSNENSSHQYTVYGDPANVNVTVEQLEWLVDKETRNSMDIGLYAEQDESNPAIWRIMFTTMPLLLTSYNPRILFRLIANGSNSSHTICDTVGFDSMAPNNIHFQIHNTSLPSDTTVSEEDHALFQCSFSYSKQNSTSVSLFDVQFTFSTMYGFCNGWYTLSNYKNNTNCSSGVVTKHEAVSQFQVVEIYSFQIPAVSVDLNGSSLVVSLIHDDKVQWKRVARLTVMPAARLETPPTIFILVPLVAIFVLGSVIIIVLGARHIIVKRKRYSRINANEDIVSLNSYEENTFSNDIKHNFNLTLSVSQ